MSSRRPLVAGNWKMNLSAAQGVALVQDIDEFYRPLVVEGKEAEVVVAPPFTAIHSVATVIEIDRMSLGLGAQNMFWEPEGAFTGEISPTMLSDARVDYVIIGHSERREHFGETDEVVNKKVKAAITYGLKPILCCGESLETREEEETLEFIEGQIREGLAFLTKTQVTGFVIAYEPIWAIGTGKTATPKMAEEVCVHIRETLDDLFGATIASNTRILYGGSVNAHNAELFFGEENIDGALVGGAALAADSFNPIIAAAAKDPFAPVIVTQ